MVVRVRPLALLPILLAGAITSRAQVEPETPLPALTAPAGARILIEVSALGRDPRIGRFGWVSDEGDLLDTRPGEEAARRHQDSGVVELEVVWRRPR